MEKKGLSVKVRIIVVPGGHNVATLLWRLWAIIGFVEVMKGK